MVFKESETIEFKRELTSEIKKEMIAFANSRGELQFQLPKQLFAI
jgi:predicted HTH transcriptional regulator